MTNITIELMRPYRAISLLRPREAYGSMMNDATFNTIFLHLDTFSNLYTMSVDLNQKLHDEIYN